MQKSERKKNQRLEKKMRSKLVVETLLLNRREQQTKIIAIVTV